MRALALVLFAFVGTALAQPAQPTSSAGSVASARAVAEKQMRRLADELHSPFCPGKSLMTCTSYQAYQLRQEMVEMAASGMSEDAIIADLKVRYGATVANPPQPWYTALVPFLPYILGAIVVVLVFRRWLAGSKADADTEAPLPDADAERLARLRARVALTDDD